MHQLRTTFTFLFVFIYLGGTAVIGQSEETDEEKGIQWLTFEEANKKAAEEEKKIFVFITTDWCKYCHRMEKRTFTKQKVINQLTDNYYPVKIIGDNEKRRDLVYSMLEGRVVFPTSVILDEDFERQKVMSGYYSFAKLYPVLVYYGGL